LGDREDQDVLAWQPFVHARQVEALGFDFLYASENLLNCIHGPSESVADAWSILAAIAVVTSQPGQVFKPLTESMQKLMRIPRNPGRAPEGREREPARDSLVARIGPAGVG